MDKIIYLIVFTYFYSSCVKQDKQTLISKLNNERIKVGLKAFDADFKLDSTFFQYSSEEDWVSVEILKHFNESLYPENKSKAIPSIIEYYTHSSKKVSKILFFTIKKGDTTLVCETDKYYKNLNNSVDIVLTHNHNFKEKANVFSIDSLPTKLLIEKNERKLLEKLAEAQESDSELCGTSASRILKKGFPQEFTHLDSILFFEIKAKHF